MPEISLISINEFERIYRSSIDKYKKLSLFADMCRANALATVKRAGSGHLGSSFSCLDIVTWLYYNEMNTVFMGVTHPDRDIYFSSKGHDCPGFYSVLYSLGIIPKDSFIKLRRIDGNCGHPDIGTPGVEANSGSLGMGIAKGKGFAFAKKLLGRKGRVFIMTGDGELQEGQIYESLQTAPHQDINNLIVIVDHNKVQSDKQVKEITDLGDLESKFRAFGWHVSRCDGHDFKELEKSFRELRDINDKPKILIADTIKGRGVSFMEHPVALKDGGGIYRWHSGAPDDKFFAAAYDELVVRINGLLSESGMLPLSLLDITPEEKKTSGVSTEYVANAFGEALLELGEERQDLIVLDADLAADCRIRAFENKYPDRFIENGIAEQDMVSMAGGLALEGLLPVVNSFASFLASRANEQIYNNACEKTRIIYVCHYAGLIPAGPGQSHQSIRDISLLGALPDFEIIQPCNAAETKAALQYCVNESSNNCVLRLIIGPSPRIVTLPEDYVFEPGKGVALTCANAADLLERFDKEEADAAIFTYGPVMLNEALIAAELLYESEGFALKVINMPWLNNVDNDWLDDVLEEIGAAFVLEDHSPVGGLGDYIKNRLTFNIGNYGMLFEIFGVEGLPAWGTPQEVLKHHRLDGASIAERITRHFEMPFI